MDINVYNSKTREEYGKRFANWLDKLDVYYDPSFLVCDANMQGGEFEIFTAIKNSDVFIYPYVKIALDRYPDFFDITSPYGYAGPFCSNARMFDEAESAFNTYISNQGCVSEFIRYHYVYNENLFFTQNVQNSQNRKIVLVDLAKGQDKIWDYDFSVTNRNLVRKLKREGYSTVINNNTDHVNEFINLYESTMRNASAIGYYFFPREFYFTLFKELKSKIIMARVLKDCRTYASALFFKSGNLLTYYLSARDIENYKVPASNLLLSEMVSYGIKENLDLFNLGGGLSNTENDNLFKFKKNFSKKVLNFFIGKRVHNVSIYESLREDFIKLNGLDAYEQRKHILQFYR